MMQRMRKILSLLLCVCLLMTLLPAQVLAEEAVPEKTAVTETAPEPAGESAEAPLAATETPEKAGQEDASAEKPADEGTSVPEGALDDQNAAAPEDGAGDQTTAADPAADEADEDGTADGIAEPGTEENVLEAEMAVEAFEEAIGNNTRIKILVHDIYDEATDGSMSNPHGNVQYKFGDAATWTYGINEGTWHKDYDYDQSHMEKQGTNFSYEIPIANFEELEGGTTKIYVKLTTASGYVYDATRGTKLKIGAANPEVLVESVADEGGASFALQANTQYELEFGIERENGGGGGGGGNPPVPAPQNAMIALCSGLDPSATETDGMLTPVYLLRTREDNGQIVREYQDVDGASWSEDKRTLTLSAAAGEHQALDPGGKPLTDSSTEDPILNNWLYIKEADDIRINIDSNADTAVQLGHFVVDNANLEIGSAHDPNPQSNGDEDFCHLNVDMFEKAPGDNVSAGLSFRDCVIVHTGNDDASFNGIDEIK